jgi:uncharacterized membrane protein
MENKYLFQLNVKTISMLSFLALLPNVLGMINLSAAGFKIHFFQYAIFIAAAIYGPVGGAISGGIGSIYSATLMSNPYILVGNIILGTFAGFFMKKGYNMILAVFFAYLIQMPWLYLTDVYLVGMPVSLVINIMVALLISDMFWATLTKYTYKPIKALAE